MAIDYLVAVFGRPHGTSAGSTPAKVLNGNFDSSTLSSTPDARLLRQMDATIRCIMSLGRPSGCGMPGSPAAAPLSQLMAAAVSQMQQLTQLEQRAPAAPHLQPSWSFIDIGAGAGRMLLTAKLFGASCCAGLELCNLKPTFEACKVRLLKKGLLHPTAVHSCTLHVGDAMHYSTSSALLGPAAAGPVMVSLIDEGMPLSVREHVYSRVAHDPQVLVVVTVNYRSRASHLPAVLMKAGFSIAQEMPAPLMGGKCSTAGRIYVRVQQQQQGQQQQPLVQQQQGHHHHKQQQALGPRVHRQQQQRRQQQTHGQQQQTNAQHTRVSARQRIPNRRYL